MLGIISDAVVLIAFIALCAKVLKLERQLVNLREQGNSLSINYSEFLEYKMSTRSSLDSFNTRIKDLTTSVLRRSSELNTLIEFLLVKAYGEYYVLTEHAIPFRQECGNPENFFNVISNKSTRFFKDFDSAKQYIKELQEARKAVEDKHAR